MSKEKAIELGKKIIESQINKDLNEVRYDKDLEAYLVSNIIPTTQFFEHRLNENNAAILQVDKKVDSLRIDMDKKFDKVDEKFNELKIDMDKRFEKVDERFEKVDEKFDKVDEKFDKVYESFDKVYEKFDKLYDLLENRDNKIRNEFYSSLKEMRESNERHEREQRSYTRNMFMMSISISLFCIIGLFLKITGVLK